MEDTAIRLDPSLRVLVVDDCGDTRETLRMVLALWGYTVQTAQDGRAALGAAVLFKPDVVLMDLALPGMDGYETARNLRRLPGLDGLPIVALTGYGTDADRNRSQAEGLASHLVKPAETDEIRRAIISAVQAAARA
jgi:CheY-like chemotaxis protein